MLMSESPLQLPPGFHCPACDYDLSGRALTGETRCSECGRVVERADLPKFEEWSLADRTWKAALGRRLFAIGGAAAVYASAFLIWAGAFWSLVPVLLAFAGIVLVPTALAWVAVRVWARPRERGLHMRVWARSLWWQQVPWLGVAAYVAVSSAARGLVWLPPGSRNDLGMGLGSVLWILVCLYALVHCLTALCDRLYRIGTRTETSRSMLTLIVLATYLPMVAMGLLLIANLH